MKSALFEVCLAAAVIAGSAPTARASDCSEAVSQAKSFLNSYAKGNSAAVVAMVEPDVVVYGSDVHELFRGPDGVRKMLAGDQTLWNGAAKIGDLQQLSITSGGNLCVLTFHAPFSLGSRAPVQVRFTMAWRKGRYGWRLAQSANSTPTVGASAEELLAGKR